MTHPTQPGVHFSYRLCRNLKMTPVTGPLIYGNFECLTANWQHLHIRKEEGCCGQPAIATTIPQSQSQTQSQTQSQDISLLVFCLSCQVHVWHVCLYTTCTYFWAVSLVAFCFLNKISRVACRQNKECINYPSPGGSCLKISVSELLKLMPRVHCALSASKVETGNQE